MNIAVHPESTPGVPDPNISATWLESRHDAGMTAWEAAQDISLGEFGKWGEFGRIAVNVDAVYRELEANYVPAGIVEQFERMAQLEERGPR